MVRLLSSILLCALMFTTHAAAPLTQKEIIALMARIKNSSDAQKIDRILSEREQLYRSLSAQEVMAVQKAILSNTHRIADHACVQVTGPTLDTREFVLLLPEVQPDGTIGMNYCTIHQTIPEKEKQKVYNTIYHADVESSGNLSHFIMNSENSRMVFISEPLRLKNDPDQANSRKIGSIYMGSNALPSIPRNCFANVFNLLTLSLHHNRITFLEDEAFSGLPRLRYLCLSHNQLQDVNPAAFIGLTALQTLDLRSNLITSLPPHLFENLPQLRKLLVSGNLIQTDDLRKIATDRHLAIDTLKEDRAPKKSCVIS